MSDEITQNGLSFLKQILFIRDYLDRNTFLKEGDKKKRIPSPLSRETIQSIKDPERGWMITLRNLVAQFNENAIDVMETANLFGMKVSETFVTNPQIKAYQLSEAILKDLASSADLRAAIKLVRSSNRISGKGKKLLIEILSIRDYLDYSTYLKSGDKKKGLPAPLSTATVRNVNNPEGGWTGALRALVSNFNNNPKDVKKTSLIFNIQIDEAKPQIKAYQFSESPSGLNVMNDSTDLKRALCMVDKAGCQLEADMAANAEGEKLFEQKNYRAALVQFLKISEASRNSQWSIQYNIGSCYQQTGDLKAALEAYKKSAAIAATVKVSDSDKKDISDRIKEVEAAIAPAKPSAVAPITPSEKKTRPAEQKLIERIKSEVERGEFSRAANRIKKLDNEKLSDEHVNEMEQLGLKLNMLLAAEKLERGNNLSAAKAIYETNKEVSPKAIGRRIEDIDKKLAKQQAAEEKKQAAEAKRLAKEEKQKAEAEARKQAAEAKKQEAEAKKREAAEAKRLKAEERKEQEVKDDVIPVVQTAREGDALKEFARTTARYTRELNGAYNRIIKTKNDPSLKGKVVFKLLVEPNGRVSRVAWLRGATSDEIINSKNKGPLINKMIASIKGWKFSKGARTTADVIAVLTNDAEEKTPEKEEFVVKRLGLGQEKINETRDRNMPALVKLCTSLATKNPTLNGTVTVNLVIEPNGKVSSAKAEFSDEMKSAKELDRFKKAVEDAVKKWKFPQAEGQTSTAISLTINQSADKSAPKLETLQQLEKAVKEHPDDTVRLRQLAWAKYKTGKYDEAIRIFRELTRTDKPYYLDATKKADCYYGLALAKGRMGARDEALENYKKASELDPSYKKPELAPKIVEPKPSAKKLPPLNLESGELNQTIAINIIKNHYLRKVKEIHDRICKQLGKRASGLFQFAIQIRDGKVVEARITAYPEALKYTDFKKDLLAEMKTWRFPKSPNEVKAGYDLNF